MKLFAIFLLFLLAAVLLTLPAAFDPGHIVIGNAAHAGVHGELFFEHLMRYAAGNHNLGHWYKTDWVNYPGGQNIGPRVANSLHLFYSLLFTSFLGPFAAYNTLALLILALNGFTMYLLARDFFGDGAISFASGFSFMISPYVLLKMNMGFIHKANLFLLPLYFLFLFRLWRTRKSAYIAPCVLLLFLVKISYPPYAYY